ncbi:unnamed protein product [Ceutorhynchus assimilis]|uniref:Uncharacterized protein n=1 Tax=Ceutorhynchus assimilis TaxID=467358 RepID=A0A9P0GRU9_9CUCU|nr:unnamed protein product [Ceutorhynchus assimilis]
MSQEVDIEAMKKCLTDANMYEDGMDEELIVQFYNAVRNSEASLQEESRRSFDVDSEAEKSLNESANELLEAIESSKVVAPSKSIIIDEEVEESEKEPWEVFAEPSPANKVVQVEEEDESWKRFVKDIPKKSRVVQEKEPSEEKNNNHKIHLENESQESDTILSVKKTPIGFYDMPESQDKNYLKVIYHNLKFVNIQNSKKFLSANSESRVKMMSYYHMAVAKSISHYASLSTIMAPRCKPIRGVDARTCINPVISSLKDEDFLSSQQEVYVSRSGRMTKKRVYNDNEVFDEILLESGSTKKSKNEGEWLKKAVPTNSKKNNSNETLVSSNNNTKKKFDLANTNSEDLFDELDNYEAPIPIMKSSTTRKKMPPIEEIMKRSSLFKDTSSPKRVGGRTNAILNAAKEQTERQKQQEEEIEKFTNSLDADSQAFEDDPDKVIFVEHVEARRITPVAPRRLINGRKRGGGVGAESLNITTKKTKSNEEPKTAAVNGVGRKNNKQVATKNAANESSPSTSRGRKEANTTMCPICRVSFPRREIEEHAATCGLDVFPTNPQNQRLTCEICDTVIPLSTQYEIHVKQCLAKKNG